MSTHGSIGYVIGRKKRLMDVECHSEMLWQICVREIYVLIKHFGSIDILREAFENLKETKNKPKNEDIEKCKPFMDLTAEISDTESWGYLMKNCQHSFINILETGYFLNDGKDLGLVFILDFNKNKVFFYEKDLHKKVIEYKNATIEEIMEFDEMPSKSIIEIVTEYKERYNNYYTILQKIKEEKDKIIAIINKVKELGGDQNIIQQTIKLIDDVDWKKKKLDMEYRAFFHRLDALNLIDHNIK